VCGRRGGPGVLGGRVRSRTSARCVAAGVEVGELVVVDVELELEVVGGELCFDHARGTVAPGPGWAGLSGCWFGELVHVGLPGLLCAPAGGAPRRSSGPLLVSSQRSNSRSSATRSDAQLWELPAEDVGIAIPFGQPYTVPLTLPRQLPAQGQGPRLPATRQEPRNRVTNPLAASLLTTRAVILPKGVSFLFERRKGVTIFERP
jgi:hypothetical protein